MGIPDCKVRYKFTKVLHAIELKKFKKDYLNLCKLHPPKTKENFGNHFIEFLNGAMEREETELD
jgi:hypothetical protein